jgi:hypothetical protein
VRWRAPPGLRAVRVLHVRWEWVTGGEAVERRVLDGAP